MYYEEYWCLKQRFSHCSLPGMIDDPGSFSGIEISASPALGPEANHLISLAIFIKSAAKAFNVPCNCTTSSCEVNAWNLFSDDTKLYPVFSEINLATLLPNSGCAFNTCTYGSSTDSQT